MNYTFEVTDIYSDRSILEIDLVRSDRVEFGLSLRMALDGTFEACSSRWDRLNWTKKTKQYFHNIELAAMWLVAQTGMKPDWIVE